MIYNYIIFNLSRFLYIFLPKGKTRFFNILIRLSKNNWRYSYYGVKIVNQKITDLTYRLSLGGGYGNFYFSYLNKFKKKFVFLDIGSNLGIYSLISNNNSNCKYILAFDPLPNIKEIIMKNFRLNKVKGKFYNVGIYKRNIKKKIYIFKDHSGKSSIINSKGTNVYIFAKFRNYLFLKKIIKNVKKEKFVIKIDVEGVEENVIKELIKSNILKNTYSIFVEIQNLNLKKKKTKIIKLLKKNKFVLKEFIKPHDYLFEKL
jgi:FkbM family methyltransferase